MLRSAPHSPERLVKRSPLRDVRRSLVYLRPHRATIAVVLALTLGGSAVTAAEPLVHKTIFDRLSSAAGNSPSSGAGASTSLAALALPIALLAGLVVLRQAGEAITALLAWRTRLAINRRLLDEATERLHQLPLAYHQGRGVGETMTRLDRGITAFMEALASVAFQMLPAIVYLGLSLAIMLRLSPPLAAVAVAFILPPLLVGRRTARTLVDLERESLDRWCRIYNRFQQVLAGIKTVKSFAREADEHDRFITSVAGAQAEVMRSVRVQTGLSAGRGLCVNVGRVAVLAAGAWLASRGQIGLGTLVAFLGYVGGLYAPAQTLLGLYDSVRRAELGLEAFFSVLDADDAVPDRDDAAAPGPIAGEVRFDRVTFRYDGALAARPALDEVSFTIRPGELVAVVGPSGAGKSTLADLVLRLHDPFAGAVLVDGHDLRTLSQRELRKRLGVVPQEPFLFDDTVAANIGYAKPDATAEQIERAARAARAHEFIERLPRGYDTLVGRGGVALSGGERQRIAIARTILKDPSIVILDEPTSALDIEAELAVQAAIERLSAGRTTILIAHRLNTTMRADRVLVLDGGRLVEEGAPAELLARDGAYHRMMTLWLSPEREPRGRALRLATET